MRRGKTRTLAAMKRGVKLTIAGFSAVAVMCITFLAAPIVFWEPCENEVLSESISPGRTIKAVKFRRDCGATTPYSIQVSVIPISSRVKQSDSGNVFVATDVQPDDVSIEWLTDQRLRLSYPRGARLFSGESNLSGLRVEYASR
jgi:hypothetical protein